MRPYADVLDEWVRAQMMAETKVIEQACEAAAQGGTCGVLLLRDRYGRLSSVEPNQWVPYGQLWICTQSSWDQL